MGTEQYEPQETTVGALVAEELEVEAIGYHQATANRPRVSANRLRS